MLISIIIMKQAKGETNPKTIKSIFDKSER